MSNSHHIVSPGTEEYPKQEWVDAYFAFFDACPKKEDLEALKKEGKQRALAYLNEKKEQIQQKIQVELEPVTERLEERAEILEVLANPPTDLEEVVEYLRKIAEYFAEPYARLVAMITWWAQFIAESMLAVQQCVAELTELIEEIQKIPDSPDSLE